MSHKHTTSMKDEIAKYVERFIRRTSHIDFLHQRDSFLRRTGTLDRERATQNKLFSHRYWHKLKQQKEHY